MLSTHQRTVVGLNSWIVQIQLVEGIVEPEELLDLLLGMLERENILEGNA